MEYWCSYHYRVHHMVTARRLIHSFTYRTAIVTASILRSLLRFRSILSNVLGFRYICIYLLFSCRPKALRTKNQSPAFRQGKASVFMTMIKVGVQHCLIFGCLPQQKEMHFSDTTP